jgi:hypothetical protein
MNNPMVDPRLGPQVQQEQGQAAAAPFLAPKAAAEAAKAQAEVPYAAQIAAAQAAKAQADARAAEAQATAGPDGPKVTAPVRAEAITGYQSAQALRKIVADLRAQFKAGPGSTKGIVGLTDYLPTARNNQFDVAGNAARGIVGQALGFTGGQLNSPQEAIMSVGPYLPQAGDRDRVIDDKIKRLEALADMAENRSIAILGGVPGPDGQIAPKPAPSVPPGNSGGGGGYTTGAGLERDPALVGVEQRYREMLAGGAPEGEILQFLGSAGVPLGPESIKSVQDQLQFRALNPNVPLDRYDTSGVMMRAGKGQDLGFMGVKGDSAVGAYGIASANMLTGGMLDELVGATGGNQQQAQLAKEVVRERNPGASLAGDITGGALGMTGVNGGLRLAGGRLAALATRGGGIGSDALYGGIYGTGENNDNRLVGGLTGAASAGAGNLAGRALIGGTARLGRGVQNEAVNYLSRRGVPLSVGQTLGNRGMFGRLWNQMESSPITQGMSANVKQDGWKAVNREAFKDALEPFGAQAQGEIGQKGIDSAQQQVGGLYDTAFGGKLIQPDSAFHAEIQGINQSVQTLPAPLRDQFNATIQQRVMPMFGQGGLNGPGLQAALKGLKMDAAALQKRSEPMADIFKDHADQVGEALTNLAERSAPGTRQAIEMANTANRHVSTLEDAVLAARNQAGVPTAAQINSAAVNNTKKFGGKKAAARGDVPFSELTTAANDVMGSTFPDSGTGTRLAAMMLPVALGGAAGGSQYMDLPTPVTASLATLAGLSTKRGSKAFQKFATARPDWMRDISEQLYRIRRAGGMFGGAAALPAVNN